MVRIMVANNRRPLLHRPHGSGRDGAWIFSGEWELSLSQDKKEGIQAVLTRYLDGPPIDHDMAQHAAERVFGHGVIVGDRGHIKYFYTGTEEPQVLEIHDPALIKRLIERGSSKIKLDIEPDLFSPAQRDLFAPESEPYNAPSQLLMHALAECGITASTAKCIAQTNPNSNNPVAYLRHTHAITEALSHSTARHR
jgi:hypothetical protein